MKQKLLKFLFLCLLIYSSAMAQDHKVSGTITAKEDGLPIPGVTVRIKGSTTGTQTNPDGKYSINAPAGTTLQFSFTGYQSEEYVVKGNTMSVVMNISSKQLGEVVVTGALGVKSQAKELGYSTAQINNKELTQAKVTDISTGLEGKVSGLQINLTNNGIDPMTRIVLRGNRSITGNNEALLVLDGVPIDDVSYINSINPDDVANVTVLKGAVAASVYGSKASNGVIIITTKKGTKGKPTITVSNTLSMQAVSYLPDLQTQFGGYGGEGGAFVNADGTVNAVPFENESYGPAFDGHKILLALSPIFAADGTTVTGYDSLFTKYQNIKNNRRDFFNNALTNQFNFGYDIGDDNSTLHLGFQDVAANGVIPGDKSRRDNIRIGGTRNYGRFNVEYTASYNQFDVNKYGASYNQTTGGLFSGDNLYFEVLNTPADIPLTSFKDYNGQYTNVNSYYNAYATNPYWTIANSRQKTNTYELLANVNLSYKIASWLNLSDRIGITTRTKEFKYTRAQVNFAPWAIADPESAGNEASSLKYVAPATYDETFFEQRINNDMILAFDKKFGKFSVKALAGTNIEQNYQRDIALEGDNLQFAGNYNISSVLGIPGYGESSYEQREFAIYEEATVGYNGYLFIHGTNRDEWNSVLDPAHNHYQYPGVDASFVFTEAINALKDKDVLSYGKIHGGITRVANINLGGGTNPYGAYSLQNPFVPPAGFPYGTLGGYSQSSLYLNPTIQPEQTTEYEIGGELGFLKNRINLTTTYSHSDSRNQSLTSVTSSATGFTAKLSNAGLVTNDVWEFDLNTIPVKTRNFQWTLGINYTHFANLVKELSPGQTQLQLPGSGSIYAVVGKPYPVIETNDWVRDPASGKVIVDPNTGQPTVNGSLTQYGTANPTQILGINNALTYKNLTFSFVLDYRGGNEIFNTQGATEAFTGVSSQSAENGRQRFIYPNSVVLQNGHYVTNTNVAVENGGNTANAGFWPSVYTSALGSIYVDDAAFWKLREAALTYQIPAPFLTKNASFIKRASIGLVGRNLLMFRPKSNTFTDPEFSDTTGNAIGTTSTNQTPPTRYYGATLSVTF